MAAVNEEIRALLQPFIKINPFEDYTIVDTLVFPAYGGEVGAE